MFAVVKNFAKPKKTRRSIKVLLSFLIPGLFFFLMLQFSHFDQVFEYDPDEGMCLMRAYMHAQGYAFYKDIWMDVPPFVNLLVSGIIQVFGPSIFHARSLILFFSTLLLWALFRIVRKTQNFLSAACAVMLLVLSSYYAKLSVSVMIGLPAVTFAILSVGSILLYRNSHKRFYLYLCGALFALGLQSKIFVIVYLPALIIAILMTEKERLGAKGSWGQSMKALLHWMMAASGVYFFLAFVTSQINFSQLTRSYMIGNRFYNFTPGYIFVKGWILEDYDVFLLALTALICAWKELKKIFFLPVTMLAVTLISYSLHKPVWYHHRLLVQVPLCWLASYSFAILCHKAFWEGCSFTKAGVKVRQVLTGLVIIFLCVLVVIRIPLKFERLKKQVSFSASVDEYRFLSLIRQYRQHADLMVTDRPIFAFYADLPQPPFVASFSWKRVYSGLIKADDFMRIIKEKRPDFILFARFVPLQDKFITQYYQLTYTGKNGSKLYIANQIMFGKRR